MSNNTQTQELRALLAKAHEFEWFTADRTALWDWMEAVRQQSPALLDHIERPIDMVLYCPTCGVQHVDEPDERTPEWDNPPHRSHLCHGCGCIWRPADVATNGVRQIETFGKADTWPEVSPRAVPARLALEPQQ